MPNFDEKHVKLCGGTVVWDGVTTPGQVNQGANAGKSQYSLKVVFPPGHPDVALFQALAQRALNESKWRGVLPGGGRMPVNTVEAGEFNDQFPGWSVISFKTTLRRPDVYGENGAPIDAMALSHVLYSGQRVDVLGHCYEYDNAGNKGVSAGLDAFAVIVSAKAPRQQFGGVNTAAAFGAPGAQQAAPAQAAPAAGAPVPPSSVPAYPAQSQGYLTPPPAPPSAPVPPAAPAMRLVNGQPFPEASLKASGWSDAQIATLPVAG